MFQVPLVLVPGLATLYPARIATTITTADALASSGSAVVVATHDSRLATFATRRVRLQDGHLVTLC